MLPMSHGVRHSSIAAVTTQAIQTLLIPVPIGAISDPGTTTGDLRLRKTEGYTRDRSAGSTTVDSAEDFPHAVKVVSEDFTPEDSVETAFMAALAAGVGVSEDRSSEKYEEGERCPWPLQHSSNLESDWLAA
jgi:hypothetical protein